MPYACEHTCTTLGKISVEVFLETSSIHKYVLLDNEKKAMQGPFYLKDEGSRYI
jgi:hypothetical protein